MALVTHIQSLLAGLLTFLGIWFGSTVAFTPVQPAAAAASNLFATATPSINTQATTTASTSTPQTPPKKDLSPSLQVVGPKKATTKAVPAQSIATSSSNTAVRLSNPYPTAPISFDTINSQARGALVNIFCIPNDNALAEISGSGVIIDPRGVILTNAHVGQYELLEESSVTINCLVRTGSPARAVWHAKLLYIPPSWINKHANEILQSHAMGTGENDFALLLVDRALDSGVLPSSFPYLSPDTREAVAFQDDAVLVASYPAGFIGSVIAQTGLFPVTTTTRIKQLMTFDTGSIDVLDVGGVVVAQAGSSGGAVVNQWGRLVGLIVTSSMGDTTTERSLRADTLAHIDRSLADGTGMHLQEFLSGSLSDRQSWFEKEVLPALKTKMLVAAGLQ